MKQGRSEFVETLNTLDILRRELLKDLFQGYIEADLRNWYFLV